MLPSGGIVVKGVDHRVEGGVSTRYGHVHPSVYQEVERYAREHELTGSGSGAASGVTRLPQNRDSSTLSVVMAAPGRASS